MRDQAIDELSISGENVDQTVASPGDLLVGSFFTWCIGDIQLAVDGRNIERSIILGQVRDR